MQSFKSAPFLEARGFFGDIIGWFIRAIIFNIVIMGIQQAFGVSQFVAMMIFLGILLAISGIGYVIRQKTSRGVDE